MNNKWIPVSSGEFPPDYKTVRVKYLSYISNRADCEGTACRAYRACGTWRWDLNDTECNVVITAWKPCGEPYRGKENV
ncbi:MAG: hypothetical protein ACRC3H_07085 [Lachnospiraceae bacterium]